jgi:hypothetical protein
MVAGETEADIGVNPARCILLVAPIIAAGGLWPPALRAHPRFGYQPQPADLFKVAFVGEMIQATVLCAALDECDKFLNHHAASTRRSSSPRSIYSIARKGASMAALGRH